MRHPEHNEHPIVTSAVIVVVVTVLLFGGGSVIGLSPYDQGRAAALVLMAGIVLGAWASQASESWSRVGYVWRFGVAWVAVAALTFACGVFGVKPGVR
ncbi:MAG TPA: hypothetical protein VK544_04040 [Gemmatimonadaceae bacterium]|nr:hypothetical protein [Gemmatimonadaceae bacterium]